MRHDPDIPDTGYKNVILSSYGILATSDDIEICLFF